jgi:Domain of unknown function (DUF1707)
MDDASLRASDADREQALVALREHLVAGRLSLEEFCERVDAVLRARVTGELAHLQDDLPEALLLERAVVSHAMPLVATLPRALIAWLSGD